MIGRSPAAYRPGAGSGSGIRHSGTRFSEYFCIARRSAGNVNGGKEMHPYFGLIARPPVARLLCGLWCRLGRAWTAYMPRIRW
jgi:hypothetical protein